MRGEIRDRDKGDEYHFCLDMIICFMTTAFGKEGSKRMKRGTIRFLCMVRQVA